ncbi:NADH kinase [Cryptococcus neoformans Tu259-1]|uniref:NADH kinase n=1 Tax=Cryptococcus neoformans Tu259-1 TaxID=1230072 RepID=A0A854QPG9_CRYNE|nr:NADH kinase [Cryptococcus neoformans var. grubii Tu259-1]
MLKLLRSPRQSALYLGKSRRSIHYLRDLPVSPSSQLRSKPRLVSCEPSIGESSAMGAANFPPAAHQLKKWTSEPTTLLLIQKRDDPRTTAAMGFILSHIQEHYPHLRLIVEPHTAMDHPSVDNLIVASPGDQASLPLHTSLVLTLGGDGTILHVSNLFSQGECPPVLSFSMGSLGFLLPFHISALSSALENTLKGPVSVLNRMRLACKPIAVDGDPLNRCTESVGEAGWQVMNEVALHRGRNTHLTVVDTYFDGQHLTEAVADGILLSTPTGSTAYSLSAGGPISHPETDAFLLTPVAPRSLSFRTVILPGRGEVKLEISPLARSPAELSIDGKEVCLLNAKESVIISRSPFPIPCVERSGNESGWVKDINSLLQFNVGFKNKSLMGHSS